MSTGNPTLSDGGNNPNSEAIYLVCCGAVRKGYKNKKGMGVSDTGLLSYTRPKPASNLPVKENNCYYQVTEDSIFSTLFAPVCIILYQLGLTIWLPSSI